MTPAPEQHMIDYIAQKVLRRPEVRIDPDTPLVSSGLVDSLALVDILLELEKITGVEIPAGKVQARDMDTVAQMFSTVQRVVRQRR